MVSTPNTRLLPLNTKLPASHAAPIFIEAVYRGESQDLPG